MKLLRLAKQSASILALATIACQAQPGGPGSNPAIVQQPVVKDQCAVWAENDQNYLKSAACGVGGGGSGSVTDLSVVSANGFSGNVANSTTVPAITLRTSITGVLKGNGTALSAATSGTDFAPPSSGTSILKGNGLGGFASAVSATDYAPATTGTSILKASSGGFANAVSGTDYQAPLSLTTTGTSGAATLIGNVINIPQYSGGGGTGNATLSPATGNTANNAVCMSNTTTTIKDCGYVAAQTSSVLPKTGSFTLSAADWNNQNPIQMTGTGTETFPAVSTLNANGIQLLQNASASAVVTIQPNAVDAVCISGSACGSAGASAALAAGYGAWITIAANKIYVTPLPYSASGGSGTVTSASVVTANGFAGTVANATTTPAFTLTTSITGLLKGNGTAISAATAAADYAPATTGSSILKASSGGFANAVAGTDYQAPLSVTTTGTSGAATLIGNVLNIPQYSGGGGTPGSTNGAIQYNNSGSFGGVVITGLVKGNGTSAPTAAVSGTDYAPATSGGSILYGNGSGGFSNATVGSGLTFSAGTLSATGGGTGNALFGTTSGNVSGDAVCMSNTTVGVADCGYAPEPYRNVVGKASNFTLTAAQWDTKTVIQVTGFAVTETFPAVSTLNANGVQFIQNTNTSSIGIQPNAADVVCIIDGVSLCTAAGVAATLPPATSAWITVAANTINVTPVIPPSGSVAPGAANQLAYYASTGTDVSGKTLGTGVLAAMAVTLSAPGGLATTTRSGTSAMGTSAIASGACATTVTTAAGSVATTDVLTWGFNSDPTGVTGYAPVSTGVLRIVAWPTAGNVNFKVCNDTSASITPGAITLNYRVVR